MRHRPIETNSCPELALTLAAVKSLTDHHVESHLANHFPWHHPSTCRSAVYCFILFPPRFPVYVKAAQMSKIICGRVEEIQTSENKIQSENGANIVIIVFGAVAGGAFGLLMILIKYISTRRELKTWEVATHVDGRTTWRSFRLSDDAPADQMPAQHSMGIYDNWLLVRFSVAFVFMM